MVIMTVLDTANDCVYIRPSPMFLQQYVRFKLDARHGAFCSLSQEFQSEWADLVILSIFSS